MGWSIGQDVKLALRTLRRSPAFTLIAVGTLVLGIIMNAGTFSLVDSLAFRPLPVRDAASLVAVFGDRTDAHLLDFSYPDYIDYRDGTKSVFRGVAGFSEGPVSLSAQGQDAVMAWTHVITPDYFDVVRPRAQLGRLLGPDDETAVLLSHAFWVRQFGSDRAVLGRSVRLNGHPFTIVGVAARGFSGTRQFAYAPELWVTTHAAPWVFPGSDGLLAARNTFWLQLVARLQPGVSLAQAKAAGDAVAHSLGGTFPASHGGRAVTLFPNGQPINPWAWQGGELRSAGLVALLGAGLILLIACTNVANLLLARGTARRREMAVRLSLGASRWRVMRHAVMESALLSMAGGALGVLLAGPFIRLLNRLQPPLDFASAFQITLDWRVVVYTVLASACAGLLAGALPAWREADNDAAATLRAASGGARQRSRLLSALVVAQVTVSMIVLVSASLFLRSLAHARQIDVGFPRAHGLIVTLDPALQGYSDAQVHVFYDRLLRDLRALPGVTRVSRANHIPMDGSTSSLRVAAEGVAATDQDRPSVLFQSVEPGWFETLGVPVLEGREFMVSDTPHSPFVAVINQTLARRLWPGASPMGRRIETGMGTAEIVGVVRDTHIMTLSESPQPVLALSARQIQGTQYSVLLRTAGDARLLAPGVRRVLARIDPTLAVMGLKTLDEETEQAYSAVQGGAIGSTTLGLLALLLTAAGLYGVVAYGVAQSQREIGIRRALGAHQSSVVGMVVGRGLRLVLIGLALGLVLAVAGTRLLRGMLYGVSPTDPRALLLTALVLTGVTVLASWLPARRAATVDPMRVMRAE